MSLNIFENRTSTMINITKNIYINEDEITFTFIRAPGPGGQNVNKVASAVQLRFNVKDSPSLTNEVRKRILLLIGKKLTHQGDLIIKANRYRTQERNKQDALHRLQEIIKKASIVPKKRIKTKPSSAVKEKRLNKKKLHGKTKSLRHFKLKNDD